MEDCEDNPEYVGAADQPTLPVPPDSVCVVPSDPQRIYVLPDLQRIDVSE